jgi:hypothetical protein
MAKSILRLTNVSASVKVSDAVATVSLATDLKLASETLGINAGSTIVTAAWVTGVVTISTLRDHGLKTGTVVTVAGMTPVGYNGLYTITVTGVKSFTYALVTDPTVATVFGTAGAVPRVSIYRVFATGNFDITRNGVVVIKSTSGQQLDLDFSQLEMIESTESISDLVVTPAAAGVQVYILLRKETGYIEGFQPQIFGSYDNPNLVTA